MKAYEVSLAVAPDRQMMAWHGGVQGPDAIFLQKLDASGHAIGSPVQVTDGKRFAYEPDLQLIDGDPLLAWYEKDSAGVLTAWLARFDAKGQPVWKTQLSPDASKARNTIVRVAGDDLHVAWIATGADGVSKVWTEVFDGAGRPRSEALAAGRANDTTWNLNAALDGAGAFYVVYDAQLGTRASELQLIAIQGGKAEIASLSSDDGFASVYPDIGIASDGRAALTWFDNRDGNEEIYLAVAPLADFAAGRVPAPQRITHTPASSVGAYLAWNGDRLALAWCDSEEGQQELYLQTFDHDGRALRPVHRLTHTPAQSSIPSIRASGSGFAIAWNEWTGGGAGHAGITSSVAMTARVE